MHPKDWHEAIWLCKAVQDAHHILLENILKKWVGDEFRTIRDFASIGILGYLDSREAFREAVLLKLRM
jgi:hypothetical protein